MTRFAKISRAPDRDGGRRLLRREPRGARVFQTEKLVPQPQEAVALGLAILNEAPIRSSPTRSNPTLRLICGR